MLRETLKKIQPLYEEPMERARSRLDSLIKPPGSLGRLEEIAVRLAGITGNTRPPVNNKVIILMAADHGVVQEGVSVAPQEITRQMLPCFLNGTAGIGVLARCTGARLVVVDMGVAGPSVDLPGLVSVRVREGTGNIARGPAMDRGEAVKAVEAGIELATREIRQGAEILAPGEMGIGNTTPSSAILAVICGCAAEEATGRGTFINNPVFNKKVEVVKQAIALNSPDPLDPLDVLAKLGGLEIAGMTGVFLAAAACRVPAVVDGFIATAAAMIAVKLQPLCLDYLFPSHLSAEAGHSLALNHLRMPPLLHLDMRLGEGTGAVLGMQLVEAAARLMNEMATFEEAALSDLDHEKINS